MNDSPKNPRTQIRLWKNNLVQQYLRYRFENSRDPYHVAFRRRPYKVLWILSHMRSASSLLTHILITNSQIAGFGEAHIEYKSPEDFKALMFKIYWENQDYRNLKDFAKLTLSETYLLDKLLHKNKIQSLSLLDLKQNYYIFLVREPRRTLNSIRDLKPHWSEEKVLVYYCDRLRELVLYAERINDRGRSLFISHDQLMNSTSATFDSLQDFLKTQNGFTEKYQVLKTTGKKHVGDHRGKIKSGQIVRKPRQLAETVSQKSIEIAQVAYEDCCTRLTQLTSRVSGS